MPVTVHTITVRALAQPSQPERSFAFSAQSDQYAFRDAAKLEGWSAVSMAAVTTIATVAEAMAELADAESPGEGD